MSSDLGVFSNAFAAQANLPVVHLLGQDSRSISQYQARRQIERWQTKALAVALFDAYGVTNGYQLEKQLLAAEPNLVFPDDRPRLFHRMSSRGEPRIAKELEKGDSDAARWVRKAVQGAPEALEVLSDPTWRLLDPTPLSHVQWANLGHEVAERSIKKFPQGLKPEHLVISLAVNPGGQDLDEHYIPRMQPLSRSGFTLVLLALRRWEVNGQLVAYYLQLLEAMERCAQAPAAPDLAPLMPDCATFLAVCFGRVHVGLSTPDNIRFQEQRLAAAREAFAAIRGPLASKEPFVCWG